MSSQNGSSISGDAQREFAVPAATERSEQADDATSRRAFLKYAGAAAAGVALTGGVGGCAPGGQPLAARKPAPFVTPRREKLRIAFIGTGGRGAGHLEETKDLPIECPCYCDVDTARMGAAAKLYPHAHRYQDYREMFDKEANNFDAVSVAAPDHHHFIAAALALQHGKHVYCEKPLTHTVWEARRLTEMARERWGKQVTQMGNQGHAMEGWRRVCAWYRARALGEIVETHTWTDRPIWPQGIGRPEGEDAVPPNLNWDAWLGPAPVRPYKGPAAGDDAGPYHWFNWRGWWDFGCGALGDMACHTMDVIFATLEPGPPTVVEPVAFTPVNKETYPTASIIRWEFPRRGWRRGFAAYWYDGQLRPTTPAVMDLGRNLPQTGSLFVGTKASLVISGDYSEGARFIPDAKNKEIGPAPKDKMPELAPTVIDGHTVKAPHFAEWVMACRGEKPADYARSNFLYSGPMTETVLLGNIALRVGRRIEWDAKNLRIRNIPDASQYVTKEYREGWRVT